MKPENQVFSSPPLFLTWWHPYPKAKHAQISAYADLNRKPPPTPPRPASPNRGGKQIPPLPFFFPGLQPSFLSPHLPRLPTCPSPAPCPPRRAPSFRGRLGEGGPARDRPARREAFRATPPPLASWFPAHRRRPPPSLLGVALEKSLGLCSEEPEGGPACRCLRFHGRIPAQPESLPVQAALAGEDRPQIPVKP